jgi:hypothetical protein
MFLLQSSGKCMMADIVSSIPLTGNYFLNALPFLHQSVMIGEISQTQKSSHLQHADFLLADFYKKM